MKFTVTLLASALVASVPVLAIPQDGPTATTTDTSSTFLVDTATATSMMSSVESEVTTTTMESTISTPVSLSPQASCIATCPDDDVRCQASCVSVPSVDEAQANRTTECVAACPQGSGTEEENAAYGRCVESCLGQFVSTNPIVATGAPMTSTMATGARTTNTAISRTGTTTTQTNTDSTATETSDSGETQTASEAEESATSAAASASTTGSNAAPGLQISGPLAGLVGLLIAALSL